MAALATVQTLEQQRKILEYFWDASLEKLDLAIKCLVDDTHESVLPSAPEFLAFYATLTLAQTIELKRGCLLLYLLSSSRIRPRLFQLEITLALLTGRDCILNSGTGSGKTLTIILPLLMRRCSVSVTISPFKRLQASQNEEISQYGLRSVVINEDTPNNPVLWKAIADGHYEHIIISPEQLERYHGHITRFSGLMQLKGFRDRVSFINIDEAHEIYLSGQPRDDTPAFRPAYAKLNVFRLKFKKSIPVLALSATLPHHIMPVVKTTLLLSPETLEKRLCLNRSNITYATRPLVSGSKEYQNLSFLIPSAILSNTVVPKTIVFFDNKDVARGACAFLRERFALLEVLDSHTGEVFGTIAARHLVKVFHSDMSKGYLQTTHKAFDSQDGKCQILCATACAATGLDFRGVINVVQYGACQDLCSLIQRTGRAVRDTGTHGLFLYLFESWAADLKVDAKSTRYMLDPDLPLRVPPISKTPKKCDRIGQASVSYITSPNCLRKFVADYLDDESSNALEFIGNICCDRHGTVDFTQFFLGPFFPGNPPTMKSIVRMKNRPTKERGPLVDLLVQWRQHTLAKCPQKAILSVNDILSSTSIVSLSKAKPEDTTSRAAITVIADESEEWATAFAGQILDVIMGYNKEMTARALSSKNAKIVARKSIQYTKTTTLKAIKRAEAAMEALEVATRLHGVLLENHKKIMAQLLPGMYTKEDIIDEQNEVTLAESLSAIEIERMVRYAKYRLWWAKEARPWVLEYQEREKVERMDTMVTDEGDNEDQRRWIPKMK